MGQKMGLLRGPTGSYMSVGAVLLCGAALSVGVQARSPAPTAQTATRQKRIAFIRGGNLWVKNGSGSGLRQLTRDGSASDPAWSPDGRLLAYAKKTKGRIVSTGVGDMEAGELWTVRADGTGNRMLFRGRESERVEGTIAGVSAPRFSPDGRRIYVFGSAWATSGTVWAVNADGSGARFLTSGNSLEVVPEGPYRGHLLLTKHEYLDEAGSWDPLYLCRPNGTKRYLLEPPPEGSVQSASDRAPLRPELRWRLLGLVAKHPPAVWTP